MKMLRYLKYLERQSITLRYELVKLAPIEVLNDINRATILQITAYLEHGHKPSVTSVSYKPYVLVSIFSCGCTYLSGDLIVANLLGMFLLIWWLLTPVPESYIKWPGKMNNIDPELRNQYLRRIRFHMSI